MFLTSIAARFLVTFLKQNQFFEPSREVLLGGLFFFFFLLFLLFFFDFWIFDFVPTFSPMFLVFPQFHFFDPLISLFIFFILHLFFFVAFLFIFFFILRFFSCFFFFLVLTFGQVKGNARDGRSRHPSTSQPKFSSL